MNGIHLTRYLALFSYFSLVGVLVAWYGVVDPHPFMLGVLLLPLVFPLRGLLNSQPYTFAWSSFLILIYFIHGVMEVFANPSARWLASLEILCSMMFYLGAILYARWRGRQLKTGSN
jgi:uncharacterized membrane protein